MRKARHELDQMPPQAREYLVPILEMGRRALRKESSSALVKEAKAQGKGLRRESITDEERAVRAGRHLMEISEELARPFEAPVQHVHEYVLRVEELLLEHPNELRMREDQGSQLRAFGVKHPEREEWFDLPLPPSDTMWHKGGLARAILLVKALQESVSAGEREEMTQRLKRELPWADYDVVYVGDEHQAMQAADRMGVEPQGVERLGGDTLDFSRFCMSRDTTQNQVCFGNDGLHFSGPAYFSARTGWTMITGQYLAQKAIYGSDFYIFDGFDRQGNQYHLKLANPRGQMRLVKAVAEGKAQAFPYRKVEEQFDFGVYSLHLSKKWYGRDDFGIRMQNMFALLKRMGQTKDGEHDVYALLDRVHRHYPFIEIGSQMNGVVDVIRWKAGKLIKQLDKEFAWRNGIPPGLEIVIDSPQDALPRVINLDGFTPSVQEAERITNGWDQFTTRCKQRTEAYQRSNPSPYHHYFYEDIDTELLAGTIDA